MLSSKDALAALSQLRPLAGRLPQRVLDLIKMESTITDPMAVVLANVALDLVLFGSLLQRFALAPIAHRLGLVLPSEEAEPT